MLHILADNNISLVSEACNALGEVRLYESRTIRKEDLQWADVLLCRSTIKVDRALLDGTKIRFVATATSGDEHFDKAFLDEANIRYANATGSNARSVAEYVFASLFSLAANKRFSLLEKSIGIIGVGHVGTWVEHIASNLGMKTKLNDPPKRERTGDASLGSIEEALNADIITLHVSYSKNGAHTTHHLFDEKRLRSLHPNQILINTSRGSVVDQDAFFALSDTTPFHSVVFDVFENEPHIDLSLFQFIDIATPHIAGHSHDGKLLGTQMVYESLCLFLQQKPSWNYLESLAPIDPILPKLDPLRDRLEEQVSDIIKYAYHVRMDDRSFRNIVLREQSQRADYFDALRGNYPHRREFTHYPIIASGLSEQVQSVLRGLGFQLT